mmetsp:Transcript_17865/g.41186  ORF Transcript_17865/g.41186 Transcript_17865/m.41186 type:complete len:402 (-) Transcript_17865:23-1228(-)
MASRRQTLALAGASSGRRWLSSTPVRQDKKRGVFVAATGQHHGKTTVTLGLVSALLRKGVKVGYQKPVGQQTVPIECDGEMLQVDRDVDIFKHIWPELIGKYRDASPVAFPPNFTRMVLDGEVQSHELRERTIKSFNTIYEQSEYLVAEGTGHIGVGSIVGLNNAQVAEAIGLDVVMVAPGGLGISFDQLAVNHAMLKHYRVNLKGVVLNRVSPKKLDMVRHYYKKALDTIGVPLFGVIPENDTLAQPSLRSLKKLLDCEFLCGEEYELRHFDHTRLIISVKELPRSPVQPRSLLIVHTSRLEVLFAFLRQNKEVIDATGNDLESGVILVGSVPEKELVDELKSSNVPALFVEKGNFDGTGFKLLEKVLGFTHKHHKQDVTRILRTCEHVEQFVDVDAITA